MDLKTYSNTVLEHLATRREIVPLLGAELLKKEVYTAQLPFQAAYISMFQRHFTAIERSDLPDDVKLLVRAMYLPVANKSWPRVKVDMLKPRFTCVDETVSYHSVLLPESPPEQDLSESSAHIEDTDETEQHPAPTPEENVPVEPERAPSPELPSRQSQYKKRHHKDRTAEKTALQKKHRDEAVEIQRVYAKVNNDDSSSTKVDKIMSCGLDHVLAKYESVPPLAPDTFDPTRYKKTIGNVSVETDNMIEYVSSSLDSSSTTQLSGFLNLTHMHGPSKCWMCRAHGVMLASDPSQCSAELRKKFAVLHYKYKHPRPSIGEYYEAIAEFPTF